MILRRLISLSAKTYSCLYKPYYIPLSFFSSSSANQSKYETTSIAVADYLVHKHQFSPESAFSLPIKYLKHHERMDSVLSFLKDSGFSQTHTEFVIQRVPQLLTSNLDKSIKPRYNIFLDLGFSPKDVVEIIMTDPWILTRSASTCVGPSILALKRVLGSNLDVIRLLKISGWFLKYDLEKTMVSNIEFMMSCGISSSQITGFVYNFPRFFLRKTEDIKEFVNRVDEMGYNSESRMFIHAIRTISSMNLKNWELKLEVFRSLGFSENDILTTFRRVPQVFAVSGKKLKEATNIFLSLGKCDISYVVRYPQLLSYSTEKRVKPRLKVVEILRRGHLLKKKLNICTVLRMTDKEFFEKYVLPNSNEVGHIIAKQAS